MKFVSQFVAVTVIALAALTLSAWPQESLATAMTHPAIPFKTEPTPLEDHGPRVLLVLMSVLGLSVAGIYVAKKRFPQIRTLATGSKRLHINDRVRLNPRCTLYVVQVDQHEILIGQCGDSLVQLDLPLANTEKVA